MAGSMDSDFIESDINDVEDGEIVEEKQTIINDTEEEKKNLRAKRFGLVDNVSKSQVEDPKLVKLYKRMKIDTNSRLEALHLHGTDSMKTEDVFAIFPAYTPASIEWLTDRTCNAVWLDQECCANALLNCSVRIRGQDPEESDDSEEESISIEDVRCALPPGRIWRRTLATQLAPNLLMSFAKYFDRRGMGVTPYVSQYDTTKKNFVFLDEGDEVAKKFRPDTGNPWSDLAREWSYYEMRSAIKKNTDRLPVRDARELISARIPQTNDDTTSPSNGSRAFSSELDDLAQSQHDLDEDINYFNEVVDEEEEVDDRRSFDARNLIGRGMQADIEEKKMMSKKIKSQITKSPSGIDLRQKLSSKRSRHYENENNSDEDSVKLKSCKHKHSKRKKIENKWEAVVKADSEEDDDNEMLRSRSHSSSKDLRRRLGKHSDAGDEVTRCKGSSVLTQKTKKFVPDMPLQIEIDNDIYFERNRDN